MEHSAAFMLRGSPRPVVQQTGRIAEQPVTASSIRRTGLRLPYLVSRF